MLPPETSAGPPGLAPSRPVVFVAGALAGLVLLLVALGLWQLRRATLEAQSRELSVLTLALADELERGLQSVDLALQATLRDLREDRLPVDADEATAALRQRADLLPLVSALWIVDPQGRRIASSGAAPAADLGSFLPALSTLATQDLRGAAVSRPFRDMTAHESALALAWPFDRPDGQPGGWVMAQLPADGMRGAFAVAAPTADVRLAIYRRDGVRLSGTLAGRPGGPEIGAARLLEMGGAAALRQLDDGSQRLLQARALEHYPLVLVMTHDIDAALAGWRNIARVAGVGVVLALGLFGALGWRLVRADGLRRRSLQDLQDEQARARQLESLGTLAGGVAHDFNNILAAVAGYGELARDASAAGSAQARQLDQVLGAAQRGKQLVQRILSFSRSRARSPAEAVFELEPVVTEVLDLLAGSAPVGIVVQRQLDAPGLALQGDHTPVFEAVMNLCSNAVLAMPGGGVLTLGLRRIEVGAERHAFQGRLRPGAYAELTVADTGTGFGDEVRQRLFEPFFTTRAPGAGTGLGLAVVHGVMLELGGAIEVQSAPGEGSTFTLYLPASTAAVDPSAEPRCRKASGQGQTVLVLDDEPALVELLEETLARLGYEPIGFTDPTAALAALRQPPQRFDAVICDEQMPGLTGTALTATLRREGHVLPVLLVSGYGGPALETRARAAGVTRLLAKPLVRADLAQALAHVFSGR